MDEQVIDSGAVEAAVSEEALAADSQDSRESEASLELQPTPEEIAAREYQKAEEERLKDQRRSERRVRRLEELIKTQSQRYDLDDFDIRPGQSAEDWLRARNAQEAGRLDELQAANAQQLQGLMLERQAELQKLGLLQQQDAPLTPSYWDQNGNPAGPPDLDAIVENKILERQRLAGLDEFHKNHPDWKEVAQSVDGISLHPLVYERLLSLPNCLETTYELAKNPELMQRMSSMTARAGAAEIVRLGFSLAASAKDRSETKAPRPPSPVRRSGATAPVDLNDPNTPMDEWLKARNAQVYGGRR